MDELSIKMAIFVFIPILHVVTKYQQASERLHTGQQERVRSNAYQHTYSLAIFPAYLLCSHKVTLHKFPQ